MLEEEGFTWGEEETEETGSATVDVRIQEVLDTHCAMVSCGCKANMNTNKLYLFFRELNSVAALGKQALDVYLLQRLRSSVLPVTGKNKGRRRKFAYTVPPFGRVCRPLFLALHGFSARKLLDLTQRLKSSPHLCFTVREHGNTKSVPHNVLAGEQRQNVEQWIVRLARQVGEWQPSDGTANTTGLTYLPSYYSTRILFQVFDNVNRDVNPLPRLSFTSFYRILGSLRDRVRLQPPKTDVCPECHLLKARMKGVRTTTSQAQVRHLEGRLALDEQYAELAGRFADHFQHARELCDHYGELLAAARTRVDVATLTFDYSQSVTSPQEPSTPGPFYFYSLINFYIFGLRNAKTGVQHNTVYREDQCGKGPNQVVSMLHHYTQRLLKPDTTGASPITTVHFVADNCSGQNKNLTVVHWLAWMVATGRLQHATLLFLERGHTRNDVDRGFGVIKKCYRRSQVYTGEQIAELIGDAGTDLTAEYVMHEHFRDWRAQFSNWEACGSLLQHRYFQFSAADPGTVRCRPHRANEWQRFVLFDPAQVSAHLHPDPVPYRGYKPIKAHDIFNKLRRYYPAEFRDEMAPIPTVPPPRNYTRTALSVRVQAAVDAGLDWSHLDPALRPVSSASIARASPTEHIARRITPAHDRNVRMTDAPTASTASSCSSGRRRTCSVPDCSGVGHKSWIRIQNQDRRIEKWLGGHTTRPGCPMLAGVCGPTQEELTAFHARRTAFMTSRPPSAPVFAIAPERARAPTPAPAPSPMHVPAQVPAPALAPDPVRVPAQVAGLAPVAGSRVQTHPRAQSTRATRNTEQPERVSRKRSSMSRMFAELGELDQRRQRT
jgi:hypothetical protein